METGAAAGRHEIAAEMRDPRTRSCKVFLFKQSFYTNRNGPDELAALAKITVIVQEFSRVHLFVAYNCHDREPATFGASGSVRRGIR
jgi:hypothetical protein